VVIAMHLEIRGKVQGVFFRESMRREAERLQVQGWVRNRSDGSVEALVQGEAAAVEEIAAWAAQGPEKAEVTQVRSQKVDLDPRLKKFERRDTA
jgi:acylphosphatase